jgi:superfamily I DNA/RNA helicase
MSRSTGLAQWNSKHEATMQLNLTGEQKRILALPLRNPILIRGVAGSGKTTVAIYRAMHLIASDNDLFRATHVCIFSYTNSLVKYVQSILGSTNDKAKISVITFHKWAWDFLFQHGFWQTHSVAKQPTVAALIQRSVFNLRKQYPNRAIVQKSAEFYKEEFSWLKGRRIFTKQEYLDAKRTGRGTSDRVTLEDKEIVWSLYESYRRDMEEKSLVDFDDFANEALKYIERNPSFRPPYSHVVVDEAQDLAASQLLLLTKLVDPDTNSITIIADAAQRIYKTGFAWADVGINVRGSRSAELKHNYRNTRQIAEAALSLLAHDPQQTDFSDQVIPDRDGPMPVLRRAGSNQEQTAAILKLLAEVNLSKESVVILHRNRAGTENVTAVLRQNGYKSTHITSKTTQRIMSFGLYTCTMPSIKGLEFDHVVLCDLNDDVIPYPPGFTDDNDELHISTERRLLYTCMTRGRNRLLLISTGKPSRYLDEIDGSKVEEPADAVF